MIKRTITYLRRRWHRRRARRVTAGGARERVARGAQYLDDVDPDWFLRINLKTLALQDGASCVLGQLHGDFRLGLGRARLFHLGTAPRAHLSPVYLGFHCVGDVEPSLQARDYANLNRAWRAEIARRQHREVEMLEAECPEASTSRASRLPRGEPV